MPRDLAAVLLDAGGTLIEERVGRAELYAQAAANAGRSVTARRMDELMSEAHGALPQRVGGHFRYSRGWFEAFIERIFVSGLSLDSRALPGVQRELFATFADPANYRSLPGALDLVRGLRARGLRLAVVSNWSEALPDLLEGLGLAEHIEGLAVSALEAYEKPDPQLFRRALARLGVAPGRAVHLGNDLRCDVVGARSAGIEPMLLGPKTPACASFRDLGAVRSAIEECLT